MLFNEIYTPTFEKEKVIQAQHRSLQLMSVISCNEEENVVRKLKTNVKTHSKTLFS